MSAVCLDCYKIINHEFLHGRMHPTCVEAWFKENYGFGIKSSQAPAENETADGGAGNSKAHEKSESVQKPQRVN